MTTEAERQFHTSSAFKLPEGYTAWEIKNDYPQSTQESPVEDKPWLRIDFKTNPEKYCSVLKEYFFEGNINRKKNTDPKEDVPLKKDFILQDNPVRSWYHPPWMHWGARGREPINGLSFGGYLKEHYLAESQSKPAQGWVCSFFNWEAATVLGDMWKDPKEPKWDKHLDFPVGSVICETIFCDVDPAQVPIAKWSPKVDACIGTLPDDWKTGKTPPLRPGNVGVVKTLHLVQVDFVARDDRSPIGWVFGTYACDGRKQADNPWDNVLPIGLQWGNDPDLLQKQYDAGQRPTQLWKNPVAMDLVSALKGDRPWLGWHDRLDGLADDFIGTCTSCHATAQLSPSSRERTSLTQVPPPQEIKGEDGKSTWVQTREEVERLWLRNLPHSTPFDDDSLSADYNLVVEFSYRNYLAWKEGQKYSWASRFSA